MARLESENIWPIEKKSHPSLDISGAEKNIGDIPEEDFENKDLAEHAFKHPDVFRQSFLENVRVENKEDLKGKSFVCLWPTKFCPVGCECCFFKSPKCAGGVHEADTSILKEGRDKLIQFVNEANAEEFVIAGGGEPFLEREFMKQIAAEVNADKLFFTTSGIWAKGARAAEGVLDGLHEAHQKNPNDTELDIRLSFDKFHAEKIAPNGDFDYVINLLDIFRKKFKEEGKFKLSFHAMWGDGSMETLLSQLPVAKREQKDTKTEIVTLDDGYSFEVRWKRLFHSDTAVDMHQTPVVKRNTEIFDEDIQTEHKGNMSVKFNKEGQEKGADILVHYDGTVLNWGATSPDNEPSIYTQNYSEIMQRAFDDVVELSFLEKGNDYRDQIISEVNPEAVKRAKAMNLRDFYSRVVLEEARTRLYLSIRATQDYIAEGRIPADVIEKWPPKIKQLISMTQEELAEAYRNSGYSIVNEYLEAPDMTAEKLAELYKLVRLGHYDITPEQMIENVEKSDFNQKEKFYAEIAKELASKVGGALKESLKERGLEKTDGSLLDASKAIFLSQKELSIAMNEILSSVPNDLRDKFSSAFDFLISGNIEDLEKGIHEIKGEDVFVEVLDKPGKSKEGAVSEIHNDHVDIQMVVSDGGDLIGLNSKNTASLKDAAPDPKREGQHLTSKPDQWRRVGKKEIAMIFPLTPHAPGGADKNEQVKRLVVKIKI